MVLQILPLRFKSQVAHEDAPAFYIIAICIHLLNVPAILLVVVVGWRVVSRRTVIVVMATSTTSSPAATPAIWILMEPGSLFLLIIIVVRVILRCTLLRLPATMISIETISS